MHRILKHQLKRHFGKNISTDIFDEKLQKLFDDISGTYDEFAKEKNFIEHVLELNSKELEDTNKKLLKTNLDLEEEIVYEVEKSRLKDKKLLEQSQIAQDKLNKVLALFSKNVISSDSDPKGIIINVSDALCEISGYTREELLGKPHSILKHPDTDSTIFREMWKTIQAKNIWHGELKNRKKDGSSYFVLVSITPVLNEDGEITHYTSIRQDITAQKAKDEFLANMSHELRTPLNAILGFSSLLKTKLTNAKLKDFADHIYASSESLLNLINDILDLSKIRNSNFSINPYKFNAHKELLLLSAQFETLTKQKSLHYASEIDKTLNGIFFGDYIRIKQIILNLVSNAVKFTPIDGHITSIINFNDNTLHISITDTGIGMSQEVQNRIFQPFAQADGSTTRKYGGTGLGLSITQSLVEIMHGTLELQSQEGVGTTFKISIPLEKLHETKPEEQLPKLEENCDTLYGHILIAEDNATNQILLSMFLDDYDLSYDIANDGVEAVEMYNPQKHDLVLMDENMPNMNGIAAMQKIREIHKKNTGPIIALTANAMEGDEKRFLQAGMDGYLSKPIDNEKLYLILKKHLKKS